MEKSKTITLFLNLFLPGIGHLYATNGQKGMVLLVFHGASLGLYFFMRGRELEIFEFFPIIMALGAWIIAVKGSNDIVEEYKDEEPLRSVKQVDFDSLQINTTVRANNKGTSNPFEAILEAEAPLEKVVTEDGERVACANPKCSNRPFKHIAEAKGGLCGYCYDNGVQL